MRIVVDTNVVASAVLFGGKPGALIRFILTHAVSAVATQEIIAEYQSTIDSLFQKYNGRELFFSADSIYSAMEIIPAQTRVDVCRDPDDNKFISCAIDGQCYYIVSGDKDLLTLKEYSNVKIVTVAEFFELVKAQGQ
jgi:putative PIN family toxin of toxin-antitoxin system